MKKRSETEQHAAAVPADADARTTAAEKADTSVSCNASQRLGTHFTTASNDDYDETEFDPGIAKFFTYLEDDRPPKQSQRRDSLMIASLVPPRLNSGQADGRTGGQIEGADFDSKAAASPSPFTLLSPPAPLSPPLSSPSPPLSTPRRGAVEPGEADETDECTSAASGDAGHIAGSDDWRLGLGKVLNGRP